MKLSLTFFGLILLFTGCVSSKFKAFRDSYNNTKYTVTKNGISILPYMQSITTRDTDYKTDSVELTIFYADTSGLRVGTTVLKSRLDFAVFRQIFPTVPTCWHERRMYRRSKSTELALFKMTTITRSFLDRFNHK